MIALGLVWDVASSRLRDLPMPHVPRSPLFDGRLSKSGENGERGFVWLSEMDLRSLEWWEQRKRQSGESGSQYAERDRKTADTLAKWIEWRRIAPHETWSGKRNDTRVTAAPPSREPRIHAWGPRTEKSATGATGRGTSAPAPSDDDDSSYGF